MSKDKYIHERYNEIKESIGGNYGFFEIGFNFGLEYTDQQTKLLTEQLEDVKRQNLELQDKLAENDLLAKKYDKMYSDLESKKDDFKRMYNDAMFKLAENEKELSVVKEYINDGILACDIMIEKFEKAKMETSKMCSQAMKQTYLNVLSNLTQQINNK